MKNEQKTYYKIAPEEPIAKLLTKITKATIGSIGCADVRPWYISFACGYYGYYETALCEMEGSPVKAYILVRLDSTMNNMVVIDRWLCKSRKRIPDKMREELFTILHDMAPQPKHTRPY